MGRGSKQQRAQERRHSFDGAASSLFFLGLEKPIGFGRTVAIFLVMLKKYNILNALIYIGEVFVRLEL